MLTVTLALIASMVVLSMIATLILHYGYRAPRVSSSRSPADDNMQYETLSLKTPKGKKLFAWFLPTHDDAATIIILHGWGASASLMLPLAVPFVRHGFNILLLDARNHGNSDSDGHSSLPRFAEDLRVAIEYLQQHTDRHNGKLILMGHSVGAGAVLYEASQRHDIAAVISLSAFAHPDWVMRRQLQRFPLPEFLITGILRYIQWVIGVPFNQIAPMNTACRVECPVLLVHGDVDERVPLSDAYAIQQRCHLANLELLLIKGGRHNSSNKIQNHVSDVLDFLYRAGTYSVKEPHR